MNTIEEAISALSKLEANATWETYSAVLDVQREALKIAIENSSGPYSQQELTQMGHPYAKRDPRPPQHPGIANVQTGLFRGAWNAPAPAVMGDEISAQVRNDSLHADFLQAAGGAGSPQIERPVQELIEEELQGIADERFEMLGEDIYL